MSEPRVAITRKLKPSRRNLLWISGAAVCGLTIFGMIGWIADGMDAGAELFTALVGTIVAVVGAYFAALYGTREGAKISYSLQSQAEEARFLRESLVILQDEMELHFNNVLDFVVGERSGESYKKMLMSREKVIMIAYRMRDKELIEASREWARETADTTRYPENIEETTVMERTLVKRLHKRISELYELGPSAINSIHDLRASAISSSMK